MIKQNINGLYLLKLFFLMLLTVVVITKAEQTLTTHAIINSDELAFQNHLARFPRVFPSSQERQQRRAHFLAADALIKAHNNKAKVPFQCGHNQFSIMSAAEKAQSLGAIPPVATSSQRDFTMNTTEFQSEKTDSLLSSRLLPSSVDYRTDYCLQPIRNQGSCGSCWAFGAVAVVEFNYCKSFGTSVALSEQQLVECTPTYSGCGGGWSSAAFQYIANQGGIDTRSSYPYTSGTNSQYGTCNYNANNKGASVSAQNPITTINPYDVKAMMQTLANNQILAVAITVVSPFFSYQSGVYSASNCGGTVNHIVAVVGYGNLNGIDYWIARNSWGNTWGLNGYILIQRGVNMCNIETIAVTTTTSLGLNWQSGTNGQVQWAYNCDFWGSDIQTVGTSGSDCGQQCINNNNCNYFSWSWGTCYLKQGSNVKAIPNSNSICGYVPSRGAIPGFSSSDNFNISSASTANPPTPNVIEPTKSPICTVCPGSTINNRYYICLGLTNVNGRIPMSATLAGIQGKQHNSNNGQFSFDALGAAIFNLPSNVQFFFDDDSSASFKLADCVKP